jgi:transposase InsO family protein
MIAFIDDHRRAYGVEPICKVLPIAPSTYYAHASRRGNPAKLSIRARRDTAFLPEIQRVFDENFQVYGVRKVWRQMQREGHHLALHRGAPDAQCGPARRDPRQACAHHAGDKAAPCPLDHVNRVFRAPAPNMLWVSDFTYLSTWLGFVHVAFVIDAYARRIVGLRVSRTVLDALEQALHERRPAHRGGLVHHSDRGSQYVSIRYTERLAEVGIEPSVGSVGDSYDNALAETINGLDKAELIHRRGPWRSFEVGELATLTWVDWFNNRRLLNPSATSRRPKPKNATTRCWMSQPSQPDSNQTASDRPGAVHTLSIHLQPPGLQSRNDSRSIQFHQMSGLNA